MKDYYKILELKFGANDEDIKKSYRYLAQKYHPDKNFDNKIYEELFKEINEAYSILGDAVKKSNYNTKYQEYFFKNSSSNTNHSSTSNNFNSSTNNNNHNEKSKTKADNKQTTSMNKETIDKSKFYNHKLFKYAVFLLAVGIGFLIYKWNDISAYYDNKDKQEQYQLLINSIQQAKTFNDATISALKIPRVTLETRWKDNLMYYKLTLLSKSGYQNNSILDSSIKDAYFETRVKTIDKITANFLDKDGFKIYSLDISISDMTRIIDDSGNVTAYTINSNTPIKPELYKDFDSWELTYTTN